MPDVSVVTPAAVVPADRLTLGATDARGACFLPLTCSRLCVCACYLPGCMAEE
jgi:hypothetical protein